MISPIPTRQALVIDDQGERLRFLSSLLQETGYTVQTAQDFASAEKIVHETLLNHVIMVDALKGTSTLPLLPLLRTKEYFADLKVVLLTTQEDWDQLPEEYRKDLTFAPIHSLPDVNPLATSTTNIQSLGMDEDLDVLHNAVARANQWPRFLFADDGVYKCEGDKKTLLTPKISDNTKDL